MLNCSEWSKHQYFFAWSLPTVSVIHTVLVPKKDTHNTDEPIRLHVKRRVITNLQHYLYNTCTEQPAIRHRRGMRAAALFCWQIYMLVFCTCTLFFLSDRVTLFLFSVLQNLPKTLKSTGRLISHRLNWQYNTVHVCVL